MDTKTENAGLSEKVRGSEKPAYLAVLPSPVRYDENISSSAKLLYAEISALSEKFGYAWADNSYFARIYGITERTVMRLLDALESAGYLCIENSGTTKRRLWCNLNHPAFPGTAPPPRDKNVTDTDKNVGASDKNVTAIYNVREEQDKGTSPPIAPKGASVPKWKPERFEAFWRYYPAIPDGNGRGRRPAKDRAARAWDKLHADDSEIDLMAAALQRQKQSRQWRDGVGIPYASTWLNRRMWRDEVEDLRDAEGDPHDGRGDAPETEALPWV